MWWTLRMVSTICIWESTFKNEMIRWSHFSLLANINKDITDDFHLHNHCVQAAIALNAEPLCCTLATGSKCVVSGVLWAALVCRNKTFSALLMLIVLLTHLWIIHERCRNFPYSIPECIGVPCIVHTFTVVLSSTAATELNNRFGSANVVTL